MNAEFSSHFIVNLTLSMILLKISYIFQVFAVGFFATMCLLLPYVSSEDPDKGTEVLGYVASLLTVAFRQVQEV